MAAFYIDYNGEDEWIERNDGTTSFHLTTVIAGTEFVTPWFRIDWTKRSVNYSTVSNYIGSLNNLAIVLEDGTTDVAEEVFEDLFQVTIDDGHITIWDHNDRFTIRTPRTPENGKQLGSILRRISKTIIKQVEKRQ